MEKKDNFKTSDVLLNEDNFRTSDKFFDSKYYNKKGYINIPKIFKLWMIYFFILSFFSILILINYIYIVENEINITINDIPELLNINVQIVVMKQFFSGIWLVLKGEATLDLTYFIYVFLFSFFISVFLVISKFKKIKQKAKITSMLSSIGLENTLYIDKIKFDKYIFKLIKGSQINGVKEKFKGKTKTDLLELLEVDDIEFKQLNKKTFELKLLKTKFPTIYDNKIIELNKNQHKYQKVNHILLGYSNVSDSKTGIVEEKVGEYYLKYLPLEMIEIHASIFGAAGSGKSVTETMIIKSLIDSLIIENSEVDKIFIHDFKNIENQKMKKFIEKQNNPELSRRVITSNTMEELKIVLEKIKMIQNYRNILTNMKGKSKWYGGKIFIVIDEINVGMAMLESKNKYERKLAQEVEMLLKDIAIQNRSAKIFLLLIGQSNQAQDNFDSLLNKQMAIKYILKNSYNITSSSCPPAVEEAGIDMSVAKKGEVLLYHSEMGWYFKYLSAYLEDDYLDKYKNIKVGKQKKEDEEFELYVPQVKSKLLKEKKDFLNKLKKAGEIDKDEEFELYDEYKQDLTQMIDEVKNGIYITDSEQFEFVKYETFIEEEEKEEKTVFNFEEKEESKEKTVFNFNFEEIEETNENEIEILEDEKNEIEKNDNKILKEIEMLEEKENQYTEEDYIDNIEEEDKIEESKEKTVFNFNFEEIEETNENEIEILEDEKNEIEENDNKILKEIEKLNEESEKYTEEDYIDNIEEDEIEEKEENKLFLQKNKKDEKKEKQVEVSILGDKNIKEEENITKEEEFKFDL